MAFFKNLWTFLTETIFLKDERNYRNGLIRWGVRQYKLLFYTARGLDEHDTLVRSAALTFYTLMSIVPIAALVFAVVKGFGLADGLMQNLYSLFPHNREVVDYLITFADKALAAAMETVADGPALAVLKDILTRSDELELVGIHSHIGSNIHDADAFIQAAKRMMLLRKTFYATDAYTLPEVDLGGGYSVAYTDGEDSMDVRVELRRLAEAVGAINRALGVPAPAISFEP